MKKLFLATQLCFFIFSCSSQKEKATSDSTLVDSVRIDKVVAADTAVPTTPVAPTAPLTDKDTVSSIVNFPAGWTMLTPQGDGYIIQRYCEADNPSIAILNESEGDFRLAHNLGQMADLYTVVKFECTSPRNFTLTLKDEYGSNDKTARIRYLDNGSNIAVWTWFDAAGTLVFDEKFYAPKDDLKNYPDVEPGNCDDM